VNGESKIAWIGHPGEMEEPLGQIVGGKWDLVAEAKKYSEVKVAQKKMIEISTNLQKLYSEFNNDGDPTALLEALESAEKELPDNAFSFRLIRFQVLSLAKDRVDEALEAANKILESDKGEDASILNNLAWIIVTPDRDTKADPKLLKLALTMATKADNLSKNEDPSVADTLAKAYFDNGDFAKAVKTQTRVIELAEGTRLEADPGLKKRLNQYKKALTKSAKSSDEK
jgi:tetratricopeptide (TPR) repeat protein